MSEQTIFSAISHVTGDAVIVPSRKGPQAVIPAESLIDVLSTLRDEQNFDSLCDITCIDYLDYEATEDGWAPPGRFGISYMLANTKSNEQLTIRVFVGPPEPTAISIADLFPGADFLEREVGYIFGIKFLKRQAEKIEPAQKPPIQEKYRFPK